MHAPAIHAISSAVVGFLYNQHVLKSVNAKSAFNKLTKCHSALTVRNDAAHGRTLPVDHLKRLMDMYAAMQ